MLRLLATTTCLLSLIFILLGLVSIAIGSTQPPKPALAGLSICASGSPCWFGIEPGSTTLEEADRILRDLGYEQQQEYPNAYLSSRVSALCETTLYYSIQTFYVNGIRLSNCPDTQIGDFLIVPLERLWQNCGLEYVIDTKQDMVIFTEFYPNSLYDPIYSVNLAPTLNVEDSGVGLQIVEWQGFVPIWMRTETRPPTDCGHFSG